MYDRKYGSTEEPRVAAANISAAPTNNEEAYPCVGVTAADNLTDAQILAGAYQIRQRSEAGKWLRQGRVTSTKAGRVLSAFKN